MSEWFISRLFRLEFKQQNSVHYVQKNTKRSEIKYELLYYKTKVQIRHEGLKFL